MNEQPVPRTADERLSEVSTDPATGMRCMAIWLRSVSLHSQADDAHAYALEAEARNKRATFPPERADPATWVLHLLANGEISVGKAREWLRDYIRKGAEGPLPDIKALP